METLSYGSDQSTPPAAEPPTAEGIILHDTYRLVSQIGYGGMGVVYEAVHTRLPGRFAVKVLLRNLMAYPEALARFAREAAIMSELRHPHVVQIVDFNVTDEQQPYFVMEYLDGHDLETELGERMRLSLPETVSIVDAIASALGLAHRRGIVHRDLKPSNVFLCDIEGWQQPFVKVLDFGVSKIRSTTRSAGRITQPGSNLVGTPHYMAPEQATGTLDLIDGRTDQFALAAMTYEMLTGHEAFQGDDQVALLYQIVHEKPRPMAEWLSWNCAGIEEVLQRALSKHPSDRYKTITEFAGALGEAAARADTVSIVSRSADRDAPSTPPSFDITQDIERVPRTHHRAVFLALVALCLGGWIIAKGWARELPDDVAITYRNLRAQLQHEPPLPQPAP